MTNRLVQLPVKIDSELLALLTRTARKLGINRSELARKAFHFALKSDKFLSDLEITLTEGDRLVLEALGDGSITIKTLTRRLSRRPDLVLYPHKGDSRTVLRLVKPKGAD